MPSRLSPRPLVPVLVQAAALLGMPAGCGDDGGGESSTANTTDTFPTAGPCAHDPDAAGCSSTGMTGTTDTTTTAGTTTGTSTTDVFPTAGPCVHDPNAPGCDSTGAETSSTGGGTDTDGTGTGGSGSSGTDG